MKKPIERLKSRQAVWLLMNDKYSFGGKLRLCLHRVDALVDIAEDQIDPFEAALGFPGFYLRKTVYKSPKWYAWKESPNHYYRRYVEHYYSLTNAEKAFLARRVANHA